MSEVLRTLWKHPGFAAITIATLALGIGATTAMFSVIDATMLQPLPYEAPDRLVRVWETNPDGMNFSASEPNYLDFRERSETLAQLAAFQGASVTLTGVGDPVRLEGLAVSHNYFATLGITPALGRGIAVDEDRPGGEAVVVLSDALWRERFGTARDVLGADILLEGRAHTVIGVMPPTFRDPTGAAFWLPLAPDAHGDRGDHWLGMIGRLAPGATAAQAGAELASIAAALGQAHPQISGWSARVASLADWLVGPQVRVTASLLFGAVGLLLLMACTSLANLMFVRANQRQGEFGVRAALGAGRSRLVRQLLAEAFALTALGVLAGLLVAEGAIAALARFGAELLPRVTELAIDGRVFVFSMLLGAVTCLAFGLGPALRASRVDVVATLKRGARGASSRGDRRLGNGLVVLQVALALVLLVSAGLLIKSFVQLRAADTGFDARQVLAVELQLGDAQYREPWQKVVFFSQLRERVSGLPGVASAGAGVNTPFGDVHFVNDVTPVERAAEVGPGGYLQAGWRVATPGFFETLGMPLLRGRTFSDADSWEGPRIIVVTDTMAERLWPGQDAVGKQLYWGGIDGSPLTVIGVVGDYQDVKVGAPPSPVMFLPHNQLPWGTMSLLVRVVGDADAVATQIRDEIRALDPTLAVPPVLPLSEHLSDAVAGPRLRTLLLGAFAGLALLMAALGIYGVTAFNVGRRRREVGLRIALGARPSRVARSFLLGGTRLATFGIALGLAGAWATTRLLESVLYATTPLDPVIVGAATLLLAGSALAAGYLPARRASRIDPMEALRDE